MQSGRLIAESYQKIVHQKIPITQQMGWQIQELHEWYIRTIAPLENNINIHQSAFAGSIYSLAMATGWTLAWFWLQQNQFRNQLVAGSAEIYYEKPLITDIHCHSRIRNAEQLRRELASRNTAGKGMRLPIQVEIESSLEICAILKIQFVATAIKPNLR